MCLGCIYGPNLDESISIYDQIEQKIFEQDCESTILGGDWNCTWDCAGVDSNIDVLDMASIPSKNRSERLKKLCNSLKLTDPYRVLYPTKRDFTYIPAILQNTNHSHLDFFCISKTLINKVGNCTIDGALSSTVFDHKGILLDFQKKVNFKKICKFVLVK